MPCRLPCHRVTEMLWEESAQESPCLTSRDIIDLAFQVQCRELPVDHAWMLYHSIRRLLPWIDDDDRVAIHSVYGAASGNGWVRPAGEPGSLLQLPRRTRLSLRIPAEREHEARALSGHELQLGSHRIRVGDCKARKLVASDTIFSRSVTGESVEDEEVFTQWMTRRLQQRGIRLRKLLCGLQHVIASPAGNIVARSVMLSDLEYADSIRLQESGVGCQQRLGCGIFLPHKSLAAVGRSQDTN